MATFRNLPNPVDELAEAVAALVEPQTDPRELGVELPSLLDQLIDAVESSSSRGGAARSKQTVPASLDVLVLLGAIDRHIRDGLRRSGFLGRFEGDRADRIRKWASRAGQWRTKQPGYLYTSIAEVRRWVIRAENILTPDPQTVETQAQPCPSCGKRTAMIHSDELGEKVQRPSLYLDKAKMLVFCRCCGTQWASQTWGLLRRVLEDRRAADIARSAR